jgi:hypothetical protein
VQIQIQDKAGMQLNVNNMQLMERSFDGLTQTSLYMTIPKKGIGRRRWRLWDVVTRPSSSVRIEKMFRCHSSFDENLQNPVDMVLRLLTSPHLTPASSLFRPRRSKPCQGRRFAIATPLVTFFLL